MTTTEAAKVCADCGGEAHPGTPHYFDRSTDMNTTKTDGEQVLESWSQPVPDAEATETFYRAVLRDRASWNAYTECPHQHRTREAAQRCADGWLLRNDPR